MAYIFGDVAASVGLGRCFLREQDLDNKAIYGFVTQVSLFDRPAAEVLKSCSATSERMTLHNAGMPNIASILKTEISRVARKEVRVEIEALKKTSTQHRSLIAALRRQIDQLENDLRRVTKAAAKSSGTMPADEVEDQGPARRFSATRLAAHRTKLGLSAASYGKLVGVSGQTIYHWEQGKARPRTAQLETLASVRNLGIRQAVERLGVE